MLPKMKSVLSSLKSSRLLDSMVSVVPLPNLELTQRISEGQMLIAFMWGVVYCFFMDLSCVMGLLDDLTCNIILHTVADDDDVAILDELAIACRGGIGNDSVEVCQHLVTEDDAHRL